MMPHLDFNGPAHHIGKLLILVLKPNPFMAFSGFYYDTECL